MANIYKKIYREIKKHQTIVIARHIGADPDALGSALGLKEIILNTFPNKKVSCIGVYSSVFKYIFLNRTDNNIYRRRRSAAERIEVLSPKCTDCNDYIILLRIVEFIRSRNTK